MYAPNPEVTAELQKKDDLPVFKKRWWHRADRLDARPVIWSLDNRPDDWGRADYGPGGTLRPAWILRHKPSNHVFWFAVVVRLEIEDNSCSCTSTRGRFQPFQNRAIKRAYRRWHARNIQPEIDAQNEATVRQFYNHFITP